MTMNPTRGLALITLTLLMGAATLFASAQPDAGPRDDTFPPPGDHDAPPMIDEGEPGERGDRGDRGGFRDRGMSDEEVDAAYRIIGELYPELAERLTTLREQDPREFKQTLERKFPRVRFLVGLQKYDPAMFDLRMADIRLDRETDALAEQLREAREADDKSRYKEVRDLLEDKVAQHFDVRQKIRAREIEMLKAKLEMLEERLDDRDFDRRDLIDQRVNELAGPDW